MRLVKVGHDITHVPPGAYMSMGPRMALLSPDDPAHAQEVARRALEVARRGGDLEALRHQVAFRLGLEGEV